MPEGRHVCSHTASEVEPSREAQAPAVPRKRNGRPSSVPSNGLLDRGNIQLAHLGHGLVDPLSATLLLVAQLVVHVVNRFVLEGVLERRRRDLPREAKAIGQPAAGPVLAAALDEPLPVVIDLLLVVAQDLQRQRRGESEARLGPAVDGHVALPAQ